MRSRKFNLIVAACDNMGIGINGNLPWSLKNELKHFAKMTTTVNDQSKKNAVIMGRKTYFGVPESKRPLRNRLNIILSKTVNEEDLPTGVVVLPNLESALMRIGQPDLCDKIENIWIVGGSGVYKEALESQHCHRLYFTDIKASFECDTFFPEVPNTFRIVDSKGEVPDGVHEENGIRYEYKIYEKVQK